MRKRQTSRTRSVSEQYPDQHDGPPSCCSVTGVGYDAGDGGMCKPLFSAPQPMLALARFFGYGKDATVAGRVDLRPHPTRPAAYPHRVSNCGGAIVLALSLAACSTPAVRIETREVRVPVAIQPLKPDQVPPVPKPLGPRPQSLSAAADTLLSKWCESVAYFLRADPLLNLSAGKAQKPLPPFPECE